jgi:EpsI family protein
MIGRRQLLFLGACAGAAGMSYGLKPRRRLSLVSSGDKIETIVPVRFGQWSSEESDGLVQPKTEGLAATLYSEMVGRIYRNAETGQQVMMLIAYGDTQSDLLQLHRPESCYPALGFELQSVSAGEMPLPGGAELPVRRIVAKGADRIEYVTYWTRMGEYLPKSAGDQRSIRLKTAMEGYVPDGVLVRFSALGADPTAAFALIDSFVPALLAATPAAQRNALVGTQLAKAIRT